MPTPPFSKKTRYGSAALISAVVSLVFLALYFGISALNLHPATFSFWNNLITLGYCLTAPVTLALSILAWRSKNDMRKSAGAALALMLVPFLILFVNFILSFIRQ
ncbi:MAG: hypothetical protein IT310_03870 [Anaerolineales bacterium]|nr:hypothetical protein [Anaerolineales bacterium]